MWKNSLKNVESDNNKILYETLLEFFLQRNGTYFLNKLRIMFRHYTTIYQYSDIIYKVNTQWDPIERSLTYTLKMFSIGLMMTVYGRNMQP